MPFLARARALYERDNVVAAIITLVEGVKQYPDNTEAFRWMLDLYCEEVQNTGLEEDLVTVIDGCQDPEGVYAWIYKRLRRSGRDRFIRRMDKARRHAGQVQGRSVVPLAVLAGAEDPEPRRSSSSAAARAVQPMPAQPQMVTAPVQPLQEVAMVATSGPMALHAGQMGQGTPALQQYPALDAVALPMDQPAPRIPAGPPSQLPPLSPPAPTRPWLQALAEAPSVLPEDRAEEATELMKADALQQEEDWGDIHPSLQQRARRHSGAFSAAPNSENLIQARDSGSISGGSASGAWAASHRRAASSSHVRSVPLPSEGRKAISDPDAVRAMQPRRVDTPVPSLAWGSSWREARYSDSRHRAHRQPEPARSTRRVLLMAAAILLAVLLLSLVAYRVFTLATGGAQPAAATSGASMEVAPEGSFLPATLQQQEQSLAAALADDPQDSTAAARLRWARALRSWLHGAPAVAPVGGDLSATSAPEELKAWYISAEILEALQQGKTRDAMDRLPALRLSASRTPGYSSATESWISGTLMLQQGNLRGARSDFERAAVDGSLPGLTGVIDVCTRSGDLACARRALADMQRFSPEHPALPLGNAAVVVAQELLQNPLGGGLDKAEPLSSAELSSLASDRRAAAWLLMVDPEYAQRHGVKAQGEHNPLLQLVQARRLLLQQQPEAAAAALKEFPEQDTDASLLEARRTLVAQGLWLAGRPELALRHLPGPGDSDTASLERFANNHPEDALARGALLAQAGELGQARDLLALLLDNRELGPQARVLALQMHLEEGNVEDVRRHIERLREHRAALVAGAALDLYLGDVDAAAARLGPTALGSLPDAHKQPWLYHFELRVRLLTLAAQGHHDALSRLLSQVRLPLALRARLQGPRVGAQSLAQALKTSPASVQQQVDIAWLYLEGEDIENAKAWATRAIKGSPEHTDAHRILARVALHQGEGRVAARHLEKAWQGRQMHPGLTLQAAQARLMAHDGLQALALLRRYLDDHPGDAKAMHLLGEAWWQTRRITRGVEDFNQRLQRLDERQHAKAAGEARLWLARFFQANEGNQRGGSQLRQAHRLLGDRPDVLALLGDYHRERGDGSHAVELYRQASDHPDADPQVHLALSKMALARKEKTLAKMALERYLKEAPSGQTATWARHQLEQLGR